MLIFEKHFEVVVLLCISDDLRKSVSDTFHAIFVPLFFATLGLKIDFLAGLVLWPTFIFCAVAILGKFAGAWLGTRLGKQSQQTSILMGVAFIPGGAMEIVVAMGCRLLK